jgi:hypothetical protein
MQLSSKKTWLTRLLALVAVCQLTAYTEPAVAQDQSNAKLKTYIECYNSLDGDVHKAIERYAEWVKDAKTGPTGKETTVSGVGMINSKDVAECRGKFTEAQGLKPDLPLDGLGAEYIKAVEGLSQVVEEMYPYYDREDYKDDKFAKGKQLHPRFVAQIAPFLDASKRFSQELDLESDRRLEAQMAALEKEQGRKLPYLNLATMHQAKLLIRLIGEETFSLDQVTTRLDAFEKAADEELKFAQDNPQELPTLWSMYSMGLEEFRKAAKERKRRVRDKTPYGIGEKSLIESNAANLVEGTREKAIEKYNSLVSGSNHLK